MWRLPFRLLVAILSGVLTLSALQAEAAGSGSAFILSEHQGGELKTAIDRYPDIFGGLWGDRTTHLLTIRVAAGATTSRRHADAVASLAYVGTTQDPLLSTQPKMWNLRFVTGGETMATLVSLAGRVPTTEPFSSDAGRSLVSWYVDPKLSSVIIGVTAITPKLTADVQSGFGKLAQLVIAAPAHLHACCYRLHDSPSWYGSDRITASDLAQCTSGFEVYKQISPGVYDYGLLTAGHCWSVGTTVQQGYLDCYNIQHTFGSVGKVTVRSYGDYVTDTEFLDSTTIGTSASPYLWYGSQSNPQGCPETSSPGAIKITGSGPNYVGRNVCFDGSVTGENCNGVVAATNVCEQFVYYECGLDKATGNGLATNGDSGGPIESANGMGTGVVVYGTDVGGDPGVEWYADITSELNALNVGLITG